MNNDTRNTEKQARVWGLLSSLTAAALLFCLLLFCAMYRPFPPPPEYGMEVNLGYSDDGMGHRQDYDPAAGQLRPVPVTPVEDVEETVESNDDEAPALPEVRKKTESKPKAQSPKEVKSEPEPEEVRPKEPEINRQALFPGMRKGKGQSAEGETSVPGDQGKPTGDVNARGYTGSGGSGGNTFSLNGRTLKSLVKPTYDSEEEGIVVVRIWVNRSGKVIKAQAGQQGTTTFDASLWRTAEKAALNSEFVPKDTAPEEQVGTISYRFVRSR